MKITSTLILIFLMSLSNNLLATHIAGSELGYTKIDSLRYEVTLTLYRKCSGLAFPSTLPITLKCGTTAVTDSVQMFSISEVKLTCDTTAFICSPLNTSGGSSGGLEKHVYLDTVDFGSTAFNSLASCSSMIRVEFATAGGRYYSSTSASYDHINFCEFLLTAAMSSPTFNSEPLYLACCDQPVYYSVGAVDADVEDSLSFSYGTTLTGSSSFTPPRIETYYPGSLSFPYSNPGADPPVGQYLDPLMGDFIFTPTNCSQATSYVLEVKEWAKDSSSNRVHVGTVRRDMTIVIVSCPSNNPPSINGPFNYSVCEGDQLCFDISSNDRPFTPPPPAATLAVDSLSLTWNAGIPGASFHLIDSSASLKTRRFCWTPAQGESSTLPYRFTVTVKDNQCSPGGRSSRAFRVTVKPKAYAAISTVAKTCGWHEISSALDSPFRGNPSYQWTVLDSTGQEIYDPTVVYFKSSNSILSTQSSDSVKIQRAGTYVIRLDFNNSPLNCPSVRYDTVTVLPSPLATIQFASDTSLCLGSRFTLNSVLTGTTDLVSYQWYVNGNMSTNDTNSSFTVTAFDSISTVSYLVQITEANGCTNTDAVAITPYLKYQAELKSQHELCEGDSLMLTLDSTLTAIAWDVGSTDRSITISQAGSVVVNYADTFGCRFIDSTLMVLYSLPEPILSDTHFCSSPAILLPGSFNSYLWNDSSSLSYLAIDTSGTYFLEVTDSNGCSALASAIINIYSPVTPYLGNDTTLCGPLTLSLTAGGTYLWSTLETAPSILISNSGLLELTFTDTNNCTTKDSINITVLDIPNQSWSDTIQYCSNSKVTLTSDSAASYLWHTGDTTQFIDAGTGSYSIEYTSFNGCRNKDTVHVQINPIPSFKLGNDTVLCGTSFLVSAPLGNSYVWNTGETLDRIITLSSGDYSVTLTGANGCSSSDTVSITLYTNLSTPTLTRFSDSVKSNLTGIHYWFLDDVPSIDANTNSIYINNRIGSFTAVHQDTNGCISDTSNSITRTAGIRTLSNSALKVYPNPSTGKVTIDAAGLGQVKSIQLYDAQGKIVENTQTINGSLIELVWTASNGVFWLVLETESATYRKQIIALK